MKFILFLSYLILFYAQSASKSEKMGTDQTELEHIEQVKKFNSVPWSDKNFYFISRDPTQVKLPYVDFNSRAIIDKDSYEYDLEIVTSINKFDLVINDTSRNMKYYSYELFIDVFDADDVVVAESSKKVSSKFNANVSGYFYDQKSILKFKFEVKGDEDYKISVTVKDNLSGKMYQKVEKYEHRKAEDALLISDIRVFDHAIKQEVIRRNNKISYRADSITISFDTYKKNKNNDYTIDLNIKKNKMFAENITDFLEGVFSSPIDLSIGLFDFVSDAITDNDTIIVEDDGIYQTFFELHTKSKFRTHQLKIPKSLFSELEFSSELQFERELITKFSVYQTVASSEVLDDDNVVHVDSASAAEIDYTKSVLAQDQVGISVKYLYDFEDSFGFSWDYIPQTEEEMKNALETFRGQIPLGQINEIARLPLKSQFGKFFQLLGYLKESNNQLSEKMAITTHLRRISFCNDNFSSFTDETYQRGSSNDGYKTAKGRVYLKHGMPDKIAGDNFITKDGTYKILKHFPIQEWEYDDKDLKFIFMGNDYFDHRYNKSSFGAERIFENIGDKL